MAAWQRFENLAEVDVGTLEGRRNRGFDVGSD